MEKYFSRWSMTHTNYCRDHSVKANNFSRFSHSAEPCHATFCLSQLQSWMSISWTVSTNLFSCGSAGLVPTVAHYIRLLSIEKYKYSKGEKNKQIETSFCHANTVKFLFISVQLDSGQFQENSQEYLRWTYNYHLGNRCRLYLRVSHNVYIVH